jgi:hypothetical protein
MLRPGGLGGVTLMGTTALVDLAEHHHQVSESLGGKTARDGDGVKGMAGTIGLG